MPLLLGVTFCMYIPLVSYFGNLNEFPFGEKALILAMLVPFACVALASFVLLLVTNIFFSFLGSGRWLEAGASPLHVFILLVILCTWLEGFVLNRGLPQITGEMNIFSSTLSLLQDFILWFSALVFGLWIWRSIARHFVPIALCLALFLSMGIADAVLGSEQKQAGRTSAYQVLEKGAFHPKDNILVLVVDALSTALVQDFLEANPEMKTKLEGFVFFENNMESATATQWSLPSILKGDLYTGGNLIQYQKDALTSPKSLLQQYASEGYNVYMSSTIPMFNAVIKDKQWVEDDYNGDVTITPKLYGLLFIRFAPYAFKNMIANTVGFNVPSPQYEQLKGDFINQDELLFSILEKTVDKKNSSYPTFHVHHINGVHEPYVIGRDGKPLPESDRFTLVGLHEQTEWILRSVISLLEEMKASGIYDSSTIVVLGDHGDRIITNERLNHLYARQAALLIKPVHGAKPFSVSKAPTSNLYLNRFIRKIHSEKDSIESVTSNLPMLRTKFYTLSSEMRTYDGNDVTRLRQVNAVKIAQKYEPAPVLLHTQYTFSLLSDKPNIAFPLKLREADFVNGWGIRLLSEVSEFSLLVAEKAQVNVGLRIITKYTGNGDERLTPYTLTVRDLVSSQQQSVTIDKTVQAITLKNINTDSKYSIKLELSQSPFRKQWQVVLESIYLE